MRVSYLGPALVVRDHPAIQHMPVSDLPASCYLAEVVAGAGVEGELIEGDVLVADEGRVAGHGDLVVARDDGARLCAYRAHRVGADLRLVPVGGGAPVMASRVSGTAVVVRRARHPIGDGEPVDDVDQTLVDAFAPWFSLPTWNTPSPADARRFHDCCRDYLQDHGAQVHAEVFAESLRGAIRRRHGGRWDDYCERALQHRAQCAEAISEYLHDTQQALR
ncbi:hypothetical protein [Salinicola sp. RZ23]|uniref:hypothetical protein n=1 Tax=Salinicola sp. RZ23 TaxID=1949087 RepID=UPI000DA1AEFA|nr:hypothetical protein [Salinicola sp. RZ23]